MAVTLAITLLPACSGDDDTGGNPADAGPGGTPDGGTPSDGATPTDGATSADADSSGNNAIHAPPGHSCPGTEATIGTGVREYEPITNGDTVYLYRGPQGGYMIYLGIHAKGLDPSDVYVDYEERFSTGEIFGFGEWRVRLGNDLGDGWFERVGVWGEIEPEYWTHPGTVRGKDIRMKVKLTDKNGCMIEDLGWAVHVSSDPGT